PQYRADLRRELRAVVFVATGQQNFLIRTIAAVFIWIVQNVIVTLFLFYQDVMGLDTRLFVPIYLKDDGFSSRDRGINLGDRGGRAFTGLHIAIGTVWPYQRHNAGNKKCSLKAAGLFHLFVDSF